MDKYTPGPWRLCVGTGATEVRGEPSSGQSNPRVCRVLRADPNAGANARLIAAAPDLLKALSALFADYKQLADSGDAGNWSLEDLPVGQDALAAIAKATGND